MQFFHLCNPLTKRFQSIGRIIVLTSPPSSVPYLQWCKQRASVCRPAPKIGSIRCTVKNASDKWTKTQRSSGFSARGAAIDNTRCTRARSRASVFSFQARRGTERLDFSVKLTTLIECPRCSVLYCEVVGERGIERGESGVLCDDCLPAVLWLFFGSFYLCF